MGEGNELRPLQHGRGRVKTTGWFSKSKGNDLITPNDEYLFPGLKPGDKWCLCCLRWKEAFDEGCAPLVELEATNEKALEFLRLDHLIANAKKPWTSKKLTAKHKIDHN